MHRNLRRLSEHLMVARVLRGVPARIQQTELFGRVYSSCFGVAPTGMIGILRRNIELMLADAARQINLPMVLSSASSERLETVVARAPDHGRSFMLRRLHGSLGVWSVMRKMPVRPLSSGPSTFLLLRNMCVLCVLVLRFLIVLVLRTSWRP
jgi:isopentenyl diphosphate isomerase/L-lactate dehydrogenase-like FMN-dependent dehydrogenase